MERWTYLLLDLLSVAFPLMASFEHRLRFHTRWPGIFLGIGVMALILIPWDVAFAAHGIWGFNPRYLTGATLLGLPLEEWLFFVTIPYACMFLYEVMRDALPRDPLATAARPLSIVLAVALLLIGVWNLHRLYTSITFIGTALFLAYHVFVARSPWLGRFYAGLAVSLIPFLLVNGILTGWLLPEPIVWYNDAENLGIRMNTIPVEDSVYLLLMLLIVTTFHERALQRS
ncbi:MAG: lycopene cyclase domain-containing protein [Flavobacteriales bacterium]|nr:MAG: lycopene cyclase domain-containing protein [Flavobacteriales bacterium]